MRHQVIAQVANYIKHNARNKTSRSSAGFEPAVPAIKRSQTYALDRTATGISCAQFEVVTVTEAPSIFNVDISN